MKATFAVPRRTVPAGWVIGGESELLDVWRPSPLLLRAPSFIYRGHEVSFTLEPRTSESPQSSRWPFTRRGRSTEAYLGSESDILFDARHDATSNIAHILQNQAAVVLHGLDALGIRDRCADVLVVVHPETPRFALDLYAVLGFRTHRTAAPVRGNLLTMSPQKFPRRSVAAAVLRARAVDLGLLTDDDPGGEPIFLARRGRRALLNLEEVEPVLARAGLRTVFAEDLPVEAQIRTVANAATIFGLHGAALGYVMFKNPDTRGLLVEAFSCGYASNWARANACEVGASWLGAQGMWNRSAILPRTQPRQHEADSYRLHPATVRTVSELLKAHQGGDLNLEGFIDEYLVIEGVSRH